MGPAAAFASVAAPAGRLQLPLMFVAAAVKAKQLPVATVGRVVVVIVVLVMNGQLTQVRARKLASAPTADPRIDP